MPVLFLDSKNVSLGGVIDCTHASSDVLLKNDQNNTNDYHFGKRQLEIYF